MKRVFAILVIIILACGGSQTATQSKQPEPEQRAAETTREPEQPPPVAYEIGQDVQVGEVRWKVLEAQDLGDTLKSDNQFIDDLTTSGHFVRVTFEVENLQGEPKTYGGVELADNQGRRFSKASDVFTFIESSQTCVLETLNPNLPKTCVDIYEVPNDAAGLSLAVGDLDMFGSDEALINLGF